MAATVAESLVIGQAPPLEYITEVALRCQIIGDIIELQHDAIEAFYQPKEKEQND